MTRARLVGYTKLEAAVYAARICKDSIDRMDTQGDNLGPRDEKLLKQLLQMDPPHESIMEHIVYRFELVLSRGCLQEERRTRVSSPSVQSSRYTLGKQLRHGSDIQSSLHKTGDDDVDSLIYQHTKNLQFLARKRREEGTPVPNDLLKYALVDAFLTVEVLTINARALKNVFRTRLGEGVLAEYRRLAWDMYDAVPVSHHLLFEDIVSKRERP